jgi:hypothetical protein
MAVHDRIRLTGLLTRGPARSVGPLHFPSSGLSAEALRRAPRTAQGRRVSRAETHHRWHGEKVAFGVVALLVLEGRPQELLDEVVDFCLKVGLPVTLGDLAVKADPATLARIAAVACAEGETIHNEPFPVTPDMVVAALLGADAVGAERRALLQRTMDLPAVCA